MEGPTALKKDWVLTQDAFDVLLAHLDRDPRRAGQKYEDLRGALITFFECRGSTSPDAHADQTLDRAARRLLEGKEIYAGNPASYFYGIARNVLREHWDSARPGSSSLDDVSPARLAQHPVHLQQAEQERQEHEQRLACLERCLRGLDARQQELIRGYYQGETAVKIENRKRLAGKLGIELNALRIRALRIREKLEDCVRGCLDRQSGDETTSRDDH
jgi:RNA polymerase sigma factor (sigma-70 family)